jgi:hypothetical protein
MDWLILQHPLLAGLFVGDLRLYVSSALVTRRGAMTEALRLMRSGLGFARTAIVVWF